MSWPSRVPTPFVSLFGDWKHAERWANKLAKRTGGEVAIFAVSSIDLPLFRTGAPNEYLVFRGIPRGNIHGVVHRQRPSWAALRYYSSFVQ